MSRFNQVQRGVAGVAARILSAALLASAAGCAMHSSGNADDAANDPNNDRDAKAVGAVAMGLQGAWDFDAEADIVTRLNEERVHEHLSSLTRRGCLNTVARAWSAEIVSSAVPAADDRILVKTLETCGWSFQSVSQHSMFVSSAAQAWTYTVNARGLGRKDLAAVGVGAFKRPDGRIVVTEVFGVQ